MQPTFTDHYPHQSLADLARASAAIQSLKDSLTLSTEDIAAIHAIEGRIEESITAKNGYVSLLVRVRDGIRRL
jgi:hypothetical protein